MKNMVIMITIGAVLLGVVVWFALLGSRQAEEAPSLTFHEVTKNVQRGAKLYDVRTADEYKAGHFAGAANWSLQDMQAGKLPDVSKNTKIYVYCRSGNRSAHAIALLKDAGYTNVTDLRGLTDMQAIGGELR